MSGKGAIIALMVLLAGAVGVIAAVPPQAGNSADALMQSDAIEAQPLVLPSFGPVADMSAPAQVKEAQKPTPKPTQAPTPEPIIIPEETPVQTPPPKGTKDTLVGIKIGLDPGHQKKSNTELEPVAPGSSKMKKKVSSGTQGRFTRVAEHEVNLAVGLLLRDMLEGAGAEVIMTRETADVNISNAERAQLFNEEMVDLGLRLHCNGSNDAKVHGAFMLVPSKNPYKDECKRAAIIILQHYGDETGLSIKRGLTYRSDQTGFNWCERPIINIEMGHMTNKEEDHKLADPAFQKKMAKGLYEGIVEYFEDKAERA